MSIMLKKGTGNILSINGLIANATKCCCAVPIGPITSFYPYWSANSGGETVDVYGSGFTNPSFVRLVVFAPVNIGTIYNQPTVTFINSGHIQFLTANIGFAGAYHQCELQVSSSSSFASFSKLRSFQYEANPDDALLNGVPTEVPEAFSLVSGTPAGFNVQPLFNGGLYPWIGFMTSAVFRNGVEPMLLSVSPGFPFFLNGLGSVTVFAENSTPSTHSGLSLVLTPFVTGAVSLVWTLGCDSQ